MVVILSPARVLSALDDSIHSYTHALYAATLLMTYSSTAATNAAALS